MIMESNVFAKFEETIDRLLDKIDELQLENRSLLEEIEGLRNNYQKESVLLDAYKSEKEQLTKRLEDPHIDKTKEVLIRQHIDEILKKLEELEIAFVNG